MSNINTKIIAILAIVFLVAISAVGYFSISKNKDSSFFPDYEKYEALAKDHPNGAILMERIRQNADLLEDNDTSNDADAYLGVAFNIVQLGDNNSAILAYKEALKLQPDNTLALNNIASSYRNIGDYKSAEEAYRKIIKINSGDVDAYRNFADVYIYQYPEDEEGFLKVLESGVEVVLNPGDILSYIAVYYIDKGDYAKAIKYFEEFLKYNPDNALIQNEINELKTKL